MLQESFLGGPAFDIVPWSKYKHEKSGLFARFLCQKTGFFAKKNHPIVGGFKNPSGFLSDLFGCDVSVT